MSTHSLRISRAVRITPGRIVLNGASYLNEAVTAVPEPADAFAIRVYKELGVAYPKFYKMDSLSKYGWLAAELLLGNAPVNEQEAYDTALIMQNGSASLTTDRLYAQSMETIASPALFVYTLPNIVLGEMAIRHGLKGETTFFISEGFDAEQLHSYVAPLLQHGVAGRVLCGWLELRNEGADVLCCVVERCDASLADFSIEALNLLYATR